VDEDERKKLRKGNAEIWKDLILAASPTAPLYVIIAPPIALSRLGLQWGYAAAAVQMFGGGCVYVATQWCAGELRFITQPTTDDDDGEEGEEEEGEDGDEEEPADSGITATAKQKAGERLPAMTTLPIGSATPMLALLLEVLTFMSILFTPSMPTMRMDLSLVRPVFLLWYIYINMNLKFLLGVDLSFMDVPTVKPFYTQFVLSVLAAVVIFPGYMSFLGRRRTAADQAAFVHLGFEAAAMFLTKQLVGGLICTDYSWTTGLQTEKACAAEAIWRLTQISSRDQQLFPPGRGQQTRD
jgi:hypothetical protein